MIFSWPSSLLRRQGTELRQPEPPRLTFAYLCEQYDPNFDPTGAPPVAFRKTGDVK